MLESGRPFSQYHPLLANPILYAILFGDDDRSFRRMLHVHALVNDPKKDLLLIGNSLGVKRLNSLDYPNSFGKYRSREN